MTVLFVTVSAPFLNLYRSIWTTSFSKQAVPEDITKKSDFPNILPGFSKVFII